MTTFRTSSSFERLENSRRTSWQRERRDGRFQPDSRSYGGTIGVLVMVVCAGLIGFMMVAL